MSPVRVVLGLIRFSPRYFVLCVSFAIFVFFLVQIPLGLATRAFFDALAVEPAGMTAWTAIALLVAAQLGEATSNVLFRSPWSGLQQKSHVLLRRNLIAGLLRGYGRHGLRASSSETISRFRDDPELMGDVLDAVCDLIGRSFFAVGAAVVMWQINPTITTVVLVPLLLSTLLAEVLGTRTIQYRAASQAATGRLTAFLGDLLGGQLALNVGGAAPRAVRRLSQLGDARRQLSVRDRVFDEMLNSLSINSIHLATGIVLLLAAIAIQDASFSVGDFALFVVYLDQLGWFPAEIARLISDLKRVDVSYGRMRELIPGDAPDALVARSLPLIAAAPAREKLERLEVRGLSYTHPDGTPGVRDVSFTLERGSFTVVTGRIGSGKSTLLQVLLGLLPMDAGEISWNGRRVDDPASFFVPPRSAYTPQVPRLFSESVSSNILLGMTASADAVESAVRAAVLERDAAALDDGLDTLVGPRGVKLSGGQVQRVAAARMFVRDAELLVIDDVSSALDTDTEALLWSRLLARRGDVTCLVVSHRPTALRHADQVLQMEGGSLTPEPTPAARLR